MALQSEIWYGPPPAREVDLAIVGAGAAGLWAARAAAARAAASGAPLRILLLDGRRLVGAKILMSGGTRCNLTHVVVSPDDYRGGNRNRIARILRAHPSTESLRIFTEEMNLPVEIEQSTGKLFPADNSARSVLSALLNAVHNAGVTLVTDWKCDDLARYGAEWVLSGHDTDGVRHEPIRARRVIVSTGGLSFPKTGSDGVGWQILRRLGHTIVAPMPALTPLALGGDLHAPLSGIALETQLTLREDSRVTARARGPMLWTHTGVSGPAALDLSGHWARAHVDRPSVRLDVEASFLPDLTFEEVDADWLRAAERNAATTIQSHYIALPHRLLTALAERAGASASQRLSQTPRDLRRRVITELTQHNLGVIDVLGYLKAEVTSGGVPLEELDNALESRLLPGLHLAGEVLHVDGRLGGFNFQWAWSAATVAGEGAIDRIRPA